MKLFSLHSPWQTQDLTTWECLLRPEYLITYPQGAAIFWQGQLDLFIYIVASGRVAMRALSANGRETIMMFCEKGGLFGEVGTFEPHPRPYTAEALVACKIYKIPLEVFLEKMRVEPALNWAVLSTLSRKTSLHINQVLGLSFGDIRYRIIGIFRYLVDSYGVPCAEGILLDVPFTHQDVADLVRSSRVSVSKIFKEFMAQGNLKKSRGRYIVTNTRWLNEFVTNS